MMDKSDNFYSSDRVHIPPRRIIHHGAFAQSSSIPFADPSSCTIQLSSRTWPASSIRSMPLFILKRRPVPADYSYSSSSSSSSSSPSEKYSNSRGVLASSSPSLSSSTAVSTPAAAAAPDPTLPGVWGSAPKWAKPRLWLRRSCPIMALLDPGREGSTRPSSSDRLWSDRPPRVGC